MRQREMCAPADSCANGESLRSSVHPAAARLRTELVCEFAPGRVQAQALCRRKVRWGRTLILYWGELPVAYGEGLELIH